MNGERNSNKKIIFGGIILILISISVILYGYYQKYEIVLKNIEIQKNLESSIEILIVGDMMLDRNVRNIIDKKGFDAPKWRFCANKA